MLVSLHSKTCVAELWDAVQSDRQALIASACTEASGQMGCGRVNLAVPNRDGWVESALRAREHGAPIYYVVTNAPAKSLDLPDTDAFFVSEERQANFLRNILRNAEYLLAPETAGVYCALQSHRVARFEATPGVVFALRSPMEDAAALCEILDTSFDSIPALLHGRRRFLEFG